MPSQRSVEEKYRVCLKLKHAYDCDVNVPCWEKRSPWRGQGFLKDISHGDSCLPLTFRLAETQLFWHTNGFFAHLMAVSINICDSYMKWNVHWLETKTQQSRWGWRLGWEKGEKYFYYYLKGSDHIPEIKIQIQLPGGEIGTGYDDRRYFVGCGPLSQKGHFTRRYV